MATTLLNTYPKSLHPIFCQRICNARPAILAKFARISKNLTPRQPCIPSENRGGSHE